MIINKFISRYKIPLTICLLTKIFLLILSNLAFQFSTHQGISSFSQFLAIWNRWDSPHYVFLSQHGYTITSITNNREDVFIVFFPFYPLLVKIISFFTLGNFILAAMIVSILGAILASILIYELCILDFDEKIGTKAVWFLNIFPTSYFMISGYTESVFLCLSLAFYLSVRKNLFLPSIFFGFLAGITRVNSILLLTLIGNLKKISNYIYSFSVMLGFSMYLLLNYILFRTPFYFLTVLHNHWYKSFSFPWIGIKNSIMFTTQAKTLDNFIVFSQEPIFLFFLLFLGVFIFLKINRSLGGYTLVSVLLFSSTSFVMSTPRYALVVFPIFIALAKLASNKFLLFLFSLLFLTLLIKFTSLFVIGDWAF